MQETQQEQEQEQETQQEEHKVYYFVEKETGIEILISTADGGILFVPTGTVTSSVEEVSSQADFISKKCNDIKSASVEGNPRNNSQLEFEKEEFKDEVGYVELTLISDSGRETEILWSPDAEILLPIKMDCPKSEYTEGDPEWQEFLLKCYAKVAFSIEYPESPESTVEEPYIVYGESLDSEAEYAFICPIEGMDAILYCEIFPRNRVFIRIQDDYNIVFPDADEISIKSGKLTMEDLPEEWQEIIASSMESVF